MPFAEPTMTEGEKQVWAATFAAFLMNGDHEPDSEATAQAAAEVAFWCVVRLRHFAERGMDPSAEEEAGMEDPDASRAMACVMAGVAPPRKVEPGADD